MFLVKIFAICLAWTFVHSSSKQHGKLLFVQKPSSSSPEDIEALLVVTWRETDEEIFAQCEYITADEDLINEKLNEQTSYDSPPETVSQNQMLELLDDCSELTSLRDHRGSGEEKDAVSSNYKETPRRIASSNGKEENAYDSGATTPGYDGIPVIFPGTKWCGAGDRAKNYDDLGLHQDTDRCCRAHDLCNDTLAPGETRKGLTNTSPFTKLSCQCDNDFYDCLSRVNTVTSNTIGNMYFNILKRECYMEDYPDSKKCKKYRTIFKLKCIEYEKDTKKPKVNQWVSAKTYKKIPFPGPLDITLPF